METARNIEPSQSIERMRAAMPKRIPKMENTASTIGNHGALAMPCRKISLVDAT